MDPVPGDRKPSVARRLGTGLLLLWFFGALAVFYVIQKPFTPAAAAAMAGAGLHLLAAGWLGLLGLGLGHRLLRWLGPAGLSTGEILVLGSGLGLGALGLLTLGLGLAGLFYRWLFLALSLLLAAGLWPDYRALYRRLRRWRPKRPGRLVAVYVVGVGLAALLTALLPPVDWDGLFYHLAAPRLFIEQGVIRPGFDVPHFNFPFLAEMLFSYAMLLAGDIAAKLVHTGYGLLLAGLVYLAAGRLLGRAAAWPAVLVLLSMPMVPVLAGWAYNDLALAFYQVAALYALLRSRQEMGESGPAGAGLNLRWLALSGLLAGLALGLKYTGFVTPLTLGLLLLWWTGRGGVVWPPRFPGGERLQDTAPGFEGPLAGPPNPPGGGIPFNPPEGGVPLVSPPVGGPVGPIQPATQSPPDILSTSLRRGRAGLKPLLAFAGPALLAALLWYLKNLLFTGNPVYPFVFNGLFWDDFRAAWYAQAGTGIGFDPLAWLQLPVLAMLGVRDVNYFDGRTGPLFLAFLPLIIAYGLFRYRAAKRPAALDALLLFALAQFLFWALGVIWSNSLWQSRLLLPALVALSPVIGWLWLDLAHLDWPAFSIRRFTNLLVGLALFLALLELLLNLVGLRPLAYLTGLESRDDYLTRRLGAYYAAVDRMNQILPAGSEVILLLEPRSYYCRVACRPDSILDRLPHDQHLYGSAAAIATAWKESGATHVLLNRQGLEFMTAGDERGLFRPAAAELAVLERDYFEQIFDIAGAYQLYALR